MNIKSKFSFQNLNLSPFFDTEEGAGEESPISSDFDFLGEGDDDEEIVAEEVDPEDSAGPPEEEEEPEEEKPKKKVSKPIKAEEMGEDEEEIVDQDTKDVEPEPEAEPGDDEKVNGRTSIKAIKAKFPTLFKDFPDLREAFYREREFSKIFGSVEDAQESSQKTEYYDTFVQAVDKGDVGLIMDAVIDMGETQATAFIENFLPAVEQRSTKVLGKITAPFVHRAIRFVFEDGKQMGGDRGKNLQIAARYMAKHLFNEDDPEKLHGQLNEPSPEKRALEEERKKFADQQFRVAAKDVERIIDSRLAKEIQRHIDPNGTMNEFTRDALAEKIAKDLQQVIVEDKAHLTRMASLWRRATKDNYDSDAKARIISAFLARAKQSLPAVVAKVKAQTKPVVKKTVPDTGDVPAQRSKSHGGNIPRSGRVDYARTSDMDILNGKITYAGESGKGRK